MIQRLKNFGSAFLQRGAYAASRGHVGQFAGASLLLLVSTGCASGIDGSDEETSVREAEQAATGTEDGLARAYELFKQQFGSGDRHQMGFGPLHISTYVPTADPSVDAVRGSATLIFDEERVIGTIVGLPAGEEFDLWFLKNVSGPGNSVAPDPDDQFVKVGTYQDAGLLQKTIDVNIGDDINFALDALIVTEKDAHPTESLVYFGARTLFEKRFFREKAGLPMTPVTGPLGTAETLDPLVARGAEVFFNETFDGNGRTCGTCHRAENNLTIDPKFIATLPANDPLFVAENNPNLAALEDPQMMREFGVILENIDGFEDPENKFVLRAVNHTLALSTTMTPDPGFLSTGSPPDQRTGWSGDGAPGRGTLHEFVLGAVVQHFTKDLGRSIGADFRFPTQEEADALEAFQLFTGRQDNPQTLSLTFKEARANSGRDLFTGAGRCDTCHRDVVGSNPAPNFDLDTGIEAFTEPSGLFPKDGGLGTKENPARPGSFGNGKFNVPPIIEAADTAPLFHNHIQGDLEDAISFYQSNAFDISPAARAFSGPINIGDQDTIDLAIFLRSLNALENIRQVRKRLNFIKQNPGGAEHELFVMAVADTQDAWEVLQARQNTLYPTARNHLNAARQTIIMTEAQPVGPMRDAYMDWAFYYLNAAKSSILQQNPLNLF